MFSFSSWTVKMEYRAYKKCIIQITHTRIDPCPMRNISVDTFVEKGVIKVRMLIHNDLHLAHMTFPLPSGVEVALQ